MTGTGPTSPRRRRRARPRPAGVAVLLLCGLAAAGVQLVDSDGAPYDWDLDTPQPNVVGGQVTYYVDPRGTTDGVTGPISALQAVRAGIAAWEIGSSRIRFVEDPSRSALGKNGTDRVNYVGWTSSGVGRLTLAVTFPTRAGSDILDMDVLFNDRDYTWDTRTPGTSGIADVQAIMTHEWGHALGADHVPLQASTMYFASSTGSTAYRSLAEDDRALVGSIYPNDTFRLTTGTLRGRVTRVGASDHRAIHVVAVSLVTNEPAASTLTQPDGRFEMRGLPRGVYRLVAAPTVPLEGAMNSFWTSGSTSFLPYVLGAGSGQNPTAVLSVTVQPDTVTVAPDFTVQSVTNPFEPNASRGQATPIALGDAVTARLESGGDEDWYGFDAEAGQKVTVSVLAWHLGSRADPALALTDSLGVPLAAQDDVRSAALFGTRTEGPDLDARLVGVTIPYSGRWYVRVRNQAPGTLDANFYALFVTPASDAPSAALTSVSAAPARIGADGASQSTLTVVPRKETGEDVGGGATVALSHDGGGSAPDVATDGDGDGRYTAVVTAPTTAGRDRFTVTVTTTEGTAVIPDAAIIVYLGPPAAATSELTVRPRRIGEHGASQATLELLPRDAQGEWLGRGRSVSFQIGGPTGTTVGAATDRGDGVYDAFATAGGTQGTATISALVDGTSIGPLGALAVGFPLDEVAAQAGSDATAFQALPGLKKKAAAALRQVVRETDGIADALAASAEAKAVGRAKKALVKLVAAEKKAKGALPALGTGPELGAALRQVASERIATAVVTSGRDQQTVDLARDLLAEGDAFVEAGLPDRAGARFLKAYRKVLPLQP